MTDSTATPTPYVRWFARCGIPLVVVLSHLGWLWRDTRMPTDLSLFWSEMPVLAAALSSSEGVSWSALVAPGGWLQFGMAAAQALAGPSALLFQLSEVFWLGVLMLAVAGLVERAAGARAAIAVGGLLGSLPAVVVYARMGWIHLPEAALVSSVAAVWWCAPPGRSRTAGVAVLGALALTLRPSALVWLAPMVLVLIRARAPWPIALAWILGAVPALASLPLYLDAKVAARARYALDVPALLQQLPGLLGGVGALAMGAGMVLMVVRGRGLRLRGAPLFVTLVHALTPVVLFFVFRAGLDNHTQGFVALAILGGIGLSSSRWSTGLIVVGFGLFTGLQHVPTPSGPQQHVVGALHMPMQRQLRNAWRPFVGWSADDVASLLQATCPDGPCVLATDRALGRPDGEEPGHLVLFLLGLDKQVQLVDLRMAGREVPRHVDALLHFDCPSLEPVWNRRYPDSVALRTQVVNHFALRESWVRGVDHQCVVRWMTRHGKLARPDLAPDGELSHPGARGDPMKDPASHRPGHEAPHRPEAGPRSHQPGQGIP